MSWERILKIVRGRNAGDIAKLAKAFPSVLEDDVRTVAKCLPFSDRTLVLADGHVRYFDTFLSECDPILVRLQGQRIEIPYRIYLKEPAPEKIEALTEQQKVIFHCLYLRHHNGFIRQKHLEQLVGRTEAFICPFTIQLLGEYVLEILVILENIIATPVVGNYAKFLSSNNFYWTQTQSRVVSYWNEYYRSVFPALDQYVGKRIVDRLNTEIKSKQS
jgi:hypothetical protein